MLSSPVLAARAVKIDRETLLYALSAIDSKPDTSIAPKPKVKDLTNSYNMDKARMFLSLFGMQPNDELLNNPEFKRIFMQYLKDLKSGKDVEPDNLLAVKVIEKSREILQSI